MTAKPRWDLVLFDLDGTIADTKNDLASAANHTLTQLGLPTHPVEEIASYVGGGLRLLLQRAMGEAGADAERLERGYQILRAYYREHVTDTTQPYPGTMAMLDALAASGAKMGVVTNKPRMFTTPLMEHLFAKRFHPIIACGSSADDDAPRKPDPTAVTLARKPHAAIPTERVVYVGDSAVDIDTARNAGLQVVSVTWGYAKREKLVAKSPDFLCDDNAALQRVLLP